MHITLINDLHKEAEIIGLQIEELTKKRELLLNVISEFSGPVPGRLNKEHQEKRKKSSLSNKKNTKKELPDGKLKFSKYLRKVIESKPDKIFYNKDLTQIMADAISEDKAIKPSGKKDMGSMVGAYLWNFCEKQGIVEKIEEEGMPNGNIWNKKGSRAAKEPTSILHDTEDPLEKSILEIISKNRKINLPALVNKLRASESYGGISKNLTGSLFSCTEKIVMKLTDKGILNWSSDNEYSIN